MRVRLIAWAALVGLVLSGGAVGSKEEKPVRVAETGTGHPTVILRIASLDTLVADGRYLADLLGKAEEAKQIEHFLKAFTENKGLEGIDTTRPLGFVGHLETELPDSPFALMVPVSNEKDLLGLLEQLNVKGEKGADGVYTVPVPGAPFPAYYCFANKYVYITARDKKNLAKDKLVAPEKVFAAGNAGTFSLTINIDEVPTKLRQLVLERVALKMADFKAEKHDKETKTQQAFRAAVSDELASQVKAFLKDGKSLRLGLDVDRQGGNLSASLAVRAQPGSAMAEAITNLDKSKSIGASLGTAQAAVTFVLHAALPETLRKALEPVLEEGSGLVQKQKMPKEQKEIVELLLKAWLPTLKRAEIDTGLSVYGPSAKGQYTIVTAVKVKDGKGLETAVKELAKKVPEELRERITFDVAKVGASNIHQLAQQPDAKALLGDGPLYFAVREDALLFAAGDEALSRLKEALTATPRNSNPLRIELAVAQVAPFLAREHKNAPAAAKKAFGKDKDSDKILIVLEGGNALRLRINAKGQVLRFLELIEQMKNKEL